MSKNISVSLPELMALAVTRGIIGFGAGLLVSNLISRGKRKGLGIPLFAFGLLSTIPIAMSVFRKGPPTLESDLDAADQRDI